MPVRIWIFDPFAVADFVALSYHHRPSPCRVITALRPRARLPGTATSQSRAKWTLSVAFEVVRFL
jgi:hypothetical protein